MTLTIWYWLFMALWLIFSGWRNFSTPTNPYPWGGTLLEFILFLIIGFKLFGSPIAGG